MANIKPARYIQLIDDIKNHVFQWATDDDWKKLPPKVNVALVTLMNELKVVDAVKTMTGKDDDSDESIRSEKKRFVAVFRKKYLEYAKMEHTEPISPVSQCNIARVLERLKNEGGNYVEFLEWFFYDFLSIEENKEKWGSPPVLNQMCSNFILNKYLFKMKDTLRIRKENISQEATRTMLLEIAFPMQKRILDDAFAQKIIDFDNKVIAATKFFSLMTAFAKKHNDIEGIEACDKIREKIEELKKIGE